MDIKDIARRLASDAEGVCRELLPHGKREGLEWVEDPGAGKIKVRIQGDKAGVWAHFGGDGEGDLLDLFVKVRGGTIGDALDWARARLGIEKPSFAGPKKRDYRRPSIPSHASAPARLSKVEYYLRQDRGLAPETLREFRIAEAPYLERPDKEDPTRLKKWPGPWILFPFMRLEPDGQRVVTNIKWLHLERRPHKTKPGKTVKVMLQENDCEPSLFGWQAVRPGARFLIVTEGEIDALTVYQWLETLGWLDRVAVLSVPAGCGRGDKQAWIEHDWDRLERFEDIVICFDGDKAGEDRKAMEEIVQRLGLHRCRIAKLPHKDPNEAHVQHGFSAEQFAEVWKAAKPLAPEELKSAASFVEKVIEQFYPADQQEPGYRLPWRRAEFLRIRPGEVTIVTGINGHGKTQALGQIKLHVADQGGRICVASPEMQPAQRLLERTVRQAVMAKQPPIPLIRQVHEWFDGRLWLYDKAGSLEPPRLMEVFLYARRRFGCDFFLIDSLMRCGIAEDDYNGQKSFVDGLVAFAKAELVHVALVAHSRKGKDEMQAPGKMDIKGTGAITDLVDNVVSFWRNKPKERALDDINQDQALSGVKREEKRVDLLHKPDAIMSVDKQRWGGREGAVHLWYDDAALSYRDRRDGGIPQFATMPRGADESSAF